MITVRELAAQLTARKLAAWSVVERAQEVAIVDERSGVDRHEHRTLVTVIVHHDVPRGRGSARLDIAATGATAAEVVEQAVALAVASVGPVWSSVPQAAPAKVALADPEVIQRELGAVARGVMTAVRRPDDIAVICRAAAMRETVTVAASSGLRTSWPATWLYAAAAVSSNATDRMLEVAASARRLGDLGFDAALAGAADDLAQLARASATPPGRCAVILGTNALLHDERPGALLVGDPDPAEPSRGAGLWSIFAAQADSAVERRGLTRYRLGAELAPGAAQLAEPLSITSDGALDFAALSAPVSDDAVAIRRFSLVERGTVAGLGMSPREAALRRTDPNGGVRNLVVSLGTWSGAPPATRTLEVRRLHAASIDSVTGDAALDIALAIEHVPGRAPRPVTGGTLHVDLVAALARAQRSGQRIRRAAYDGPDRVLIDEVDLA